MHKKGNVLEIKDRPNLISIMVGAVIISLVVNFILGKAFHSYKYIQVLQIVSITIILLISAASGLTIDVVIKINVKTGWVYARNRIQYWEGFCDELTQFIVVQKNDLLHSGRQYTLYKIFLGLSDRTNYEIMLNKKDVRIVMEAIEMAKQSREISDQKE